ncbi:RPS22 [Symbiodinium sp. CCMP2592]|nr:RPS22 [Symbiodinium sp. CCMP2592]
MRNDVPWTSLRDFAGFRAAERKPVLGRLAVPPSEDPEPLATTAADRVKQRLAALRGAPAGEAPKRVAGIATAAPKRSKEEPVSEILAFRCTGKGCGHHWVTGRGTTSCEQICKACGESVVGVPSKGSVFCEVDQEGVSDSGEVVKIRLERHVAPGWATLELEDRLLDFVRAEIKFVSQFFQEEGIRDYVAYRSGKRLEGDEGRDRNKDALLAHRAARVVDALCRAEFTNFLRAGEADAKLQAFLKGRIQFSLTSSPERDRAGAVVAAAVDFEIELDIEDRIADKADDRLQRLRKVMAETDKKVLEKYRDKVPEEGNIALVHPRKLLAELLSGFDWRRALSDNLDREGHDQVRCMTCRFLAEDCSADVPKSLDVRHALRAMPSFVFGMEVVLTQVGGACKDWASRAGDILEAIAQSRGSGCFIWAQPDAQDQLLVQIFSQPDWLMNAADRLRAYATGSSATGPSISDLVGLGKKARGLRVVEPKEEKFEAVRDLPEFLDFFASPAEGDAASGSKAPFAHVRWGSAAPLPSMKRSAVPKKTLQDARRAFRAYFALEDLLTFVDFLRDFRQCLRCKKGFLGLSAPLGHAAAPRAAVAVIPALAGAGGT